MNFSSPEKVIDTVRASDEVRFIRSENRTKINDQANGAPPLSAHDAEQLNVRINVNWGEMAVLMAHARRQYENAILGQEHYFTVNIPLAPQREKKAWEIWITQFINRKMKENEEYSCVKEYQFASVVSHGIGAQVWRDRECWCPDYVAIEDLVVPTDTKTSLKGMGWFAERHDYTPGELASKVFGKNSDPGWNKPHVGKILDAYKEMNYDLSPYTWTTSPEKMDELRKQNAGYYSSDAMPSISLYHFYYQDEESPTKLPWKMKIVPDYGDATVKGAIEGEFVYDSEDVCANKLHQLLQVQYGDLNTKSPFMFWSVRSLGFLLLEPCFYTNLTRCRLLQHLHENMNMLFRVTDPQGRGRAQKIQLYDRAIMEEGVSIVPSNERHQINHELVAMGMSQLKQLQSEASVSYTQDADTGTQKEQTAFEVHAKLAQVNAMMGALLGRAFRKETHNYREICRRFCLSATHDEDALEFQAACEKQGIKREFVNVEYWDIMPEVPLGAGNPTLAIAESNQLMAMRPAMSPTAQQEVLHEAIEVITNDPKKAARWAPLDAKTDVSDSTRDAEFAFATLMWGGPVRMKEGLNPIDQIETLLGLMSGVIARVEQQDNLGTPGEVAGLQNVAAYVAPLIQLMEADKQQKEWANNYKKMLGKLMNAVKGFQQRLQQEQQSKNGNGGLSAEDHAKIAAAMTKAHVDGQIKAAKAKQQAQQKDRSTIAGERRKDAAAFAEIQRQNAKAKAEVQNRRYAAFSNPKKSNEQD